MILNCSFCVNLEELTVIISTVEDKNELRLLRSTPTFKQLKSLIVLNLESKDIDESLLYDQVIQMDIFCSQYFFLKFNSNRCNTYWNDFSPFPSIQNRTDVTLKIDKSSELDQSETFDMSDAVSVKDPTFMQRRTTTAKAVRVLDCFYYEKVLITISFHSFSLIDSIHFYRQRCLASSVCGTGKWVRYDWGLPRRMVMEVIH